MKALLVFLLVALATLHALPSQIQTSFDFDPFVIGGEAAKPGEFPWQLSLQVFSNGKWYHTCGASLFSAKYALTAAHCVSSGMAYRVVAGLHQLSNPSLATIVNVKSFKIHEKYLDGTGTYSNDIAVLTFAADIKFTDKIKPAVMPADNKNKFVNESCIISGWGRTGASGVLPDTLQKGMIRVISNAECQRRVGSMGKIVNGHLCIFDPVGLDTSACNGDSGGPVLCKVAGVDTVVGAASWVISSAGVCSPIYPSAYTRFSEYLDWIKMNTP
ncbi:hypothetical protein HELRODRAFT_185620 [Helobdella robusta]|uniref:Peptidase S1 domain-containing protein n=1 Tax=Helobdella robusta TaxID=6412 RepID=T1FN19_HELRO|nr:hypothetical protein HELRODRAFT_185620 [Helobdella robusta]ESO03652.1 hypothetical protein HELRODRAFT_185620 [Helobdella robusta]